MYSNIQLIRMAAARARSALAEEAYLATGLDLTRPMSVNATLTTRCNYRCSMCMHWRDDFPRTNELSTEDWRMALNSLYEFLGRFQINFLGGEAFLKKGFIELLEHCGALGVHHGTTTNGSLLRGEMIHRLVASRPRNINISVDGPTPEIHDRSRGVVGSLVHLERAIHSIVDEQIRKGVVFPIRIKTTIHAWNFQSMPGMIDWTERVKADSVDFEPIAPWSPEARSELWLKPDQLNELRSIIAELVERKRSGSPIETSEHRLLSLPDYFARKPVVPEIATCRTGLRAFNIAPNGDVTGCFFYEPIGNVRYQSAREIWQSAAAKRHRQETVSCERGCAYSCLAQKPLSNMVERVQLLRSMTQKNRSIEEDRRDGASEPL